MFSCTKIFKDIKFRERGRTRLRHLQCVTLRKRSFWVEPVIGEGFHCEQMYCHVSVRVCACLCPGKLRLARLAYFIFSARRSASCVEASSKPSVLLQSYTLQIPHMIQCNTGNGLEIPSYQRSHRDACTDRPPPPLPETSECMYV